MNRSRSEHALHSATEFAPSAEVRQIGHDESFVVDPQGPPLAVTASAVAEQRLLAVVGNETRFGIVGATVGGKQVTYLTRLGAGQESGTFAGRLSDGGDGHNVGPGYTANVDGPREVEDADFHVGFTFGEAYATNNVKEPLSYISISPSKDAEVSPIQATGSARFLGRSLKRAQAWLKSRSNRSGGEHPQWAITDGDLQKLIPQWEESDAIRQSVKFRIAPHSLDSILRHLHRGDLTSAQKEVVAFGTHQGRPAVADIVTRSSDDMVDQRFYIANMLARDPETAEALVGANIAGVHFTRSSTLGSMLTFNPKLLSAKRASEGKAITFGGGDAFTMGSLLQDSIAFAEMTQAHLSLNANQYGGGPGRLRSVDDLRREQLSLRQAIDSGTAESPRQKERAERWIDGLGKAIAAIEEDPESAFAQLTLDDFPIALGISAEAVTKQDANSLEGEEPRRIFFGESYIGEFRPVRSEISLPELPVVAVPRAKIALVQRLLHERGFTNTVVPYESVVQTQYI